MTLTANGWPVVSRSACRSWSLNRALPPIVLLDGPGGFVLAHLALWHHDVVEALGGAVLDDWGWCPPRPIRGGGPVTAHASGTAADLNAQLHPMGVRHSYSTEQIRTIRARLRRRYDGAIGWGGDWKRVADEMHYQLDCTPRQARAVADRLRDTPRGRRLESRNPGATRW